MGDDAVKDRVKVRAGVACWQIHGCRWIAVRRHHVAGGGPGGRIALVLIVAARHAPGNRFARRCPRVAPGDTQLPRVGVRAEHAAGDAAVAPDDLAAPAHRVGGKLRQNRHARERARELHRAARVEEPGALRQVVVAGARFGGVLEDRLHHVRRERRVGLEHQRDGAADDRRGHARAGQAEVRLARRLGRAPQPRGWIRGEERADGSAVDSMPTPGATRSGLAFSSIGAGPRELNAATMSSRRSTVPRSLEAPTVSTHGALPGEAMPPSCGCPAPSRPRLPAAATTTMPASTARLAASVSGSVGERFVDAGGDREVDDANVVRACCWRSRSRWRR